MPVNIIDTLARKNNGDFPVANLEDIASALLAGAANKAIGTDANGWLELEEKLSAYNVNFADLASAFLPDGAASAGTSNEAARADHVHPRDASKVDLSVYQTAIADLQGQIDQIEISAGAEAVVAPEVAAARVDALGTSFQTLKARIDWAQARSVLGMGNLTEDNVQDICTGDADNLPNNRVFGVSIADSATIAHFPSRYGQIVTFGTGPEHTNSGDFQVFFAADSTVFYRSIWGGTWSDWRTVADGGKAVSGAFNITADNVNAVCGGNANNLPNNRIYGISFGTTLPTNFPALSGQMVTFGTGAARSASGDFQIFIQRTGEFYCRSIWGGTWSEWKRIDNINSFLGAGNITGSNVDAICGSDANGLPNNRIYGVSIASTVSVQNFPARSGQMLTFGTGPLRSGSGDIQIFVENNGTFHYRSIWSGTWSAWRYMADGGKSVSGVGNITLTNVADICQSDANNLPNNRIYGVSFGTTNVSNFPARAGQIVTFGTGAARSNSGDFQVFFKNDGTLYYRSIWSGVWSEWTRTGGYWAIAGAGNITASNVATICNNDADNVPNNRIYGVSISTSATVANFPARSGQMITFGCANVRSASGDSQIFIQNTGAVYYRYIWSGTWSPWKSLANEQPVKILTLGDSIALGDRNGNKGFVGDIGYPYKNIAVGGARLSYDPNESYKNIPQQLIDETEYEPDIIVANGGINDYVFNYPLGTMGSAPVTTDEEAANLDKGTLTGGAEYLFYQMHKKYPYAQRYFVIVHKVQRDNGDYYPTRQNSQGYTQQDMHDRLVAVCKLYNVEVIDVYDNGIINTKYPVYRSTVWWRDDHSITAYVDVDGLHPCPQGYLHGYAPLVKRAIQSGTSKG